MEKARGGNKLQTWAANALLDATDYKGPRDFGKKPAEDKPKKAPGKKSAAKAPAKKRVPVRPAAKAAAPAKEPAKVKSSNKAKPAASRTDESWRLEPQFRDRKAKKL